MKNVKVASLAVLMLCASCAGIETIAKIALDVTKDHVIEDVGGFYENHQEPFKEGIPGALEAAIAYYQGDTNTAVIKAVDVAKNCLANGCHSINI